MARSRHWTCKIQLSLSEAKLRHIIENRYPSHFQAYLLNYMQSIGKYILLMEFVTKNTYIVGTQNN